MKKFLLGTTAIVAAASVAAPAFAADPVKLSVGGYMNQYIGFVSAEKDSGTREYRNFDQQSDSEIWFSGSTTLDNGLKFSVRVEIEADGEDASGTIDESYLEVSSATLGSLKLGYDDPATALAHASAPNYGIGLGDLDSWLVNSGVRELHNTYVTAFGSGDESKVTYFTPRFYGFQLGGSYIPELTDGEASGQGGSGRMNGEMPNAINGGGDAWVIDLNYSDTIGGVGVKGDVGYARATGKGRTSANTGTAGVLANYGTSDGYQAGVVLSYAGFEFGGGWAWNNYDYGKKSQVGQYTGFSGDSGEGWIYEIGGGYKSGPWGVSLTYLQSEIEGGVAATGTNTNNDKQKAIELSGLYNLGPGIDVVGSLFWVDYKGETGVDTDYTKGGWAFVTGFKLAF